MESDSLGLALSESLLTLPDCRSLTMDWGNSRWKPAQFSTKIMGASACLSDMDRTLLWRCYDHNIDREEVSL